MKNEEVESQPISPLSPTISRKRWLLLNIYLILLNNVTSAEKKVHNVHLFIFIPYKMNVFGGILESPFLSVRPSVCLSVYKILVSVKVLAGVISHS